jgi:uncharacterized protein YciI
MTTFQFAMLLTGPNREAIQPEQAERHQKSHLAYLQALVDEGKVLLLGPVTGGGDLRGIVVLTVESTQEAYAILDEDPWVAAGGLKTEIHPWWAAKGIMRRPSDILDHTSCYLGLLRRPAGSPEFSEDELKELQKGHMANINRMAGSGDLVLAGPMGDDGALRGIFIFRTPDDKRIRELVSRDPSVQAGRLEMELLQWTIPRGALPEE